MAQFLAILLVVHGFIHLYGFANTYFLQKVKFMSWEAIVPLSSRNIQIIAIVWLFTTALLWATALSLTLDQPWWRITAITSVFFSQFLIILYFKNTWLGTISNIFILGVLNLNVF